MQLSRERVCELTSRKLADASATLHERRAVIGLDGFVDEIIAVVDKRHADGSYDAVRTIDHLGRKIAGATGQSSNYELVVKQMKLGGNGPLMANALASAGVSVTYVGALGYPSVHPVFEEFARKMTEVVSIAEPAHTDALEFEDGKLMLGKLTPLGEVSWDTILARLGRERLKELMARSSLIGMVNWTMLPHMSRIWAQMLDDVIPNAERHTRKLFVDLADPEKRTHGDILDALKLLTRFQDQVDVVLGLNLKESVEIADVLGLPGWRDPEEAIEENAAAIRRELNLACVVIHPRRGAAAATESEVARFAGPFVQQPKISTGAGDHFNAGFCLGKLLGFSLAESLCAGVGLSGFYVRTGASPTAQQLSEFIANLPPPQG